MIASSEESMIAASKPMALSAFRRTEGNSSKSDRHSLGTQGLNPIVKAATCYGLRCVSGDHETRSTRLYDTVHTVGFHPGSPETDRGLEARQLALPALIVGCQT